MRWILGRRKSARVGGAAHIALSIAMGLTTGACRRELAPPIPMAGKSNDPRRGGTLRLACAGDIRGLDPAGPTDGLSAQAIHLIFAGLVDFDEHANIVSDLADHWESGPDGLTYRFVLRENVVMQDGFELTAADVKRSVERALHPSTPNPSSSYFENVAGYGSYVERRSEHLDGVVAEGRYAVAFHLASPDATFLSLVAMLGLRPVCRTGGDRYVDTWVPCGAGPFKLLAGGWQRGTSLRLVRDDRYYRHGLPYLDAVEWTFNVPWLPQRFRFEAGDIDILREMSQADELRFARDPRWAPFSRRDADTTLYGESMNTRIPPFDNVEVRRAVAAAIDREHYRLLKPASVTPVTQPVPPDIPGGGSSAPCQRYDYPAALEHMRKAGYPYDPETHTGGWPKTIDYLLYDHGLLLGTAQVLQQELAKIGLRIELRLVSYPAFLSIQQRADGAAMSQGNWGMDYPDPSSFFEPLFTSAAIGPESSSNTAFFSNRRLDDIVVRAHHELDERRRASLYREAAAIVCEEAPWAFTYSYHWFEETQPYVRGAHGHPVWLVDPTQVWLDRDESSALETFARATQTRDPSP